MRSSLGAAGKRAGPAGGRARTGRDEPRSGRERGPGATPAREQIGKVLRKIRIFSGPRGETCRKIKGIGGIPRVYSGVWWQALADTVLGGLFPPLRFTPGYSAPPVLPEDGDAAFLLPDFPPWRAERLLRLKTLA